MRSDAASRFGDTEKYKVTLLWLKRYHNVRSQQKLSEELNNVARDIGIVSDRGTAQPTLSRYASKNQLMGENFRRIMSEYLSRILERKFVFPKDCGEFLEKLEKDGANLAGYLYREPNGNDSQVEESKQFFQQNTHPYLEGSWKMYFHSRRDNVSERMIRKSLLFFKPSSRMPHMEVISIGESTIWKGKVEEKEG